MMSSRGEDQEGGYSADFLEEVPESLTCPICFLALRDPLLLACCGNHMCQACVDRIVRERMPCPLCKSDDFKGMLDKGKRREVRALSVRCCHSRGGSRRCAWTGELQHLDAHLGASMRNGGCPYEEEKCRHEDCGVRLQRRLLEAHEERECSKRPTRCCYCDRFEDTYEKVASEHWQVCKSYPVPCPNAGCDRVVDKIPRNELAAHLAQTCLMQTVECEYSVAGCTARPRRGDLSTHVETALHEHNALLLRQVTALTRQLATLSEMNSPCPPLSFTLVDFDRLKKRALPWWSSPFYSHPRGYKMKIVVYPSGHEYISNHVSVYCHLMRGEFDEDLAWPFRGRVVIELLNQSGDNNHFSHTIDFSAIEAEFGSARARESSQRVCTGDCLRGYGTMKFISHKELLSPTTADTVYIANNTRVDFRVRRVEIP